MSDYIHTISPDEFSEGEEGVFYANALFGLMGLDPELYSMTGVRCLDGEEVVMIFLRHTVNGDDRGAIPVAVLPTPAWFLRHIGEPEGEIAGDELMSEMAAFARKRIPGLLSEIGDKLADPELELEALMRAEEEGEEDSDEDEDDDEGFEGFGREVG